MNPNGKVAWITGGTRMGLAVAQGLSQKGCRIVLTYRSSRPAALSAVKTICDEGGDAVAFPCDLSRKKDILSTTRSILARYRRLDILINLSSIYEKAAEWDSMMQTNARSAYDLSLAVAPAMKKAGAGRIVHISDWTSASGRPRYHGFESYYVSKKAIEGVVESLALALAPEITVNAIAPGPMIPPPELSRREVAAVTKATPLARWGGAEEMAKAVSFLVDSDFVTGETIRVDGGRHLL